MIAKNRIITCEQTGCHAVTLLLPGAREYAKLPASTRAKWTERHSC